MHCIQQFTTVAWDNHTSTSAHSYIKSLYNGKTKTSKIVVLKQTSRMNNQHKRKKWKNMWRKSEIEQRKNPVSSNRTTFKWHHQHWYRGRGVHTEQRAHTRKNYKFTKSEYVVWNECLRSRGYGMDYFTLDRARKQMDVQLCDERQKPFTMAYTGESEVYPCELTLWIFFHINFEFFLRSSV